MSLSCGPGFLHRSCWLRVPRGFWVAPRSLFCATELLSNWGLRLKQHSRALQLTWCRCVSPGFSPYWQRRAHQQEKASLASSPACLCVPGPQWLQEAGRGCSRWYHSAPAPCSSPGQGDTVVAVCSSLPGWFSWHKLGLGTGVVYGRAECLSRSLRAHPFCPCSSSRGAALIQDFPALPGSKNPEEFVPPGPTVAGLGSL